MAIWAVWVQQWTQQLPGPPAWADPLPQPASRAVDLTPLRCGYERVSVGDTFPPRIWVTFYHDGRFPDSSMRHTPRSLGNGEQPGPCGTAGFSVQARTTSRWSVSFTLWSRALRGRGQRKPEFSSVQFSCSVVTDSLQPHGLQHTRPPCPSPAPRACSNLCSLSR